MDKQIEVAFATPGKQMLISVILSADSIYTIQQVINKSGILQQFPEIDLEKMSVGIFAKKCQLETVVESGDRVEIYRPLHQNPMDARRNRAIKN